MSLLSLVPWPYRLLAIATVVAGAFGAGFIKGQSYEQGREAIQALAETRAVTKADKTARIEVAKAADKSVARDVQIRIVYRDVIKEVIRYAETDNGRAVCINADWVRNHNRAADPAKNDPATGSPPSVPAWEPSNAQTLGVVTANYETCNGWRNDLIAWQEWYRSAGLAEQR